MRWFIALGVICISGGALFWLFSGKEAPPEDLPEMAVDAGEDVSPLFTEVPLVTTKKEERSEKASGVALHLSLPEVHLVHRPELAAEATKFFGTIVDDVITDFIKDSTEASTTPSGSGQKGDLNIGYTVLLASPTVISLRFDHSALLPGAPRAESGTLVANYDLERHARISTTDLFVASTTALSFLSAETRRMLLTQFEELDNATLAHDAYPGTEPTEENFSDVGLTKDAVVVIFNPRRVAPYARGTILVSIPHDAVAHLLAPEILEAIRLAKVNISEAVPEEMMKPEGTQI